MKIDNLTFTTQRVTVKAGTTVTWINEDDIPHTVASSTKTFKSKALDTDDKFPFSATSELFGKSLAFPPSSAFIRESATRAGMVDSMENGICYVNGSFVPASEARVSIFDRGFTSGEGVYDVTRSFGHKLFKLDEHIARLYRSLKYTRIDCGMPPTEMTRLSIDIFERNKHLLAPDDDCALWQVISRGADRFAKGRPVAATVTIFCVPIAYHTFAREYVEGCIVVTPSTRRTPPQSLEAKAKITNKVNHTIAAFEAKLVNPRATPLMLDLDGNISETHLGNFFFVAGGKLHTSTSRTVLGGITRSTLFSMAGEMSIPVVEGNFTPYDVYCADEAFTASTSPSIVPVKSLNGSAIGKTVPGPVTLKLMREWEKVVGIDFVSQALGHIEDLDKQSLLGQWAKLREA